MTHQSPKSEDQVTKSGPCPLLPHWLLGDCCLLGTKDFDILKGCDSVPSALPKATYLVV